MPGIFHFPIGATHVPEEVERMLHDTALAHHVAKTHQAHALRTCDIGHRLRQIAFDVGMPVTPALQQRLNTCRRWPTPLSPPKSGQAGRLGHDSRGSGQSEDRYQPGRRHEIPIVNTAEVARGVWQSCICEMPFRLGELGPCRSPILPARKGILSPRRALNRPHRSVGRRLGRV